MPEIVTDKLARRQGRLVPMIEIELPCCGETARLADLAGPIRCETCGVTVDLAPDQGPARPAAAPVATATACPTPALAA